MLPFFASYASGIPGFSVADVLLVVCCAFAIVDRNSKRINGYFVFPTLIVVALFLITLFNSLTVMLQRRPELDNILIRTIRYFFYLAIVAICSRRKLNLEMCRRWIKCICLIATCYILAQYILYTFAGIILRGYLPFLKLYVGGYATTDYSSLYESMYRPTSFFLEPAHYARYMLIGVALYLFDGNNLTLRQIVAAVFISVGILISTSAQGYVLLALLWLLCLFIRTKTIESKNLRTMVYLVCILLPIILFAIVQFPFVQHTLLRAFNIDATNLANENTAFGARIGGFEYYLNLPTVYQVIGMGFGVVPKSVWMSSAAYWLYGSGFIVFALYITYALRCLVSSHGSAKIIGLLFLALFFTDDSFYSYMCVLFISLSCLKPIGSKTV